MAIKEDKSFTRTQIGFRSLLQGKGRGVFVSTASCLSNVLNYFIQLSKNDWKKKIVFPIYRVGKEEKRNQNPKLFPLLVQMERFILAINGWFSPFSLLSVPNVHLLSLNGKILTSFHAPYRDRKCHFAKLMMKKEYFPFHTLTTQTIPLLPTIEWNIFFAPYRERKP